MPDILSTIFNMGDNFCDFLSDFLHTISLLKKVHSKREKIALKRSNLGANSFLLGRTPFLKEEKIDRVVSSESVHSPKLQMLTEVMVLCKF